MKEIHLNGSRMTDRAVTHAYLKYKLDLPEYYGGNLDALWDCLSTDMSDMKIMIHHSEAIAESLGDYGEAMLQLFREVEVVNEYIQVEIYD